MCKKDIFQTLKNGLVVSCQALPHEPMYSENGGIMPKFALAAKLAGAVGIRANGVRDIKEIKEAVDLPIIGIIKKDYPNAKAYITPTMKEVDELVELGVEIIATEFTTQTRPNNQSAYDFVKEIKAKYPNQLIMADCATIDDALKAAKAGADFIGTTMCGYTDDSVKIDGPNFDLIKEIASKCDVPIIAEGKIYTPQDAKKSIDVGSFCVVVGGAITRPLEIASRFVKELNK